MALKPNAQLVFNRYIVEKDGFTIVMVAPDPGPGQDSEYTFFITQAEFDATTGATNWSNLAITKLTKAIRNHAKLDAMIGRSITLP